jgi:hypothetical protein
VGAVIIGGSPNDIQDNFIFDWRNDTLFQVTWEWIDDRWEVTSARDIVHIENGVHLSASDFLL